MSTRSRFRALFFVSLAAFSTAGLSTATAVENETKKESQSEVPTDAKEARRWAEAIASGQISFDHLKFGIEKGEMFQPEMLTETIHKLEGKAVTIRGYILPTNLFREKGIKRFILVRDNKECCFGPGAALYDCVVVKMVPGKTADYVPRIVTVKGKFKVSELKYPDGSGHLAVFEIAGESVR